MAKAIRLVVLASLLGMQLAGCVVVPAPGYWHRCYWWGCR